MAFDQPLEADRVELNLLSAFIHVPIVGGLMWLVAGGDEKKKKEDRTRKILKSMQRENTDEKRIQILNNESISSIHQSISNDDYDPKILSGLGQKSPRLVSSEVSVSSIGCEEISELSAKQNFDQACCDVREPALNVGKNRKKTMSWSESLVEYMDGSMKHEPINPSSVFERPIKSALTRATSTRTNATELKRYLPKGMDRRHDGIKMPKAPYSSTSGSSNSGVESPQWGWYISTTPPTPEMYNRRSTLSVETVDSYMSDSSSRIEECKEGSKPNSVFQNMRQANRAPRGWPNVPL